MKKLFLLITILTLCLCSVYAYAEADENFTAIVETKQAKAGDLLEIDIVLENNPGILAMLLELRFDAENLELQNVKDKGLLAGPVFGNNYATSPYKMLWNSASQENFYKNGVLVTLSFKVLESAQSGLSEITLTYNSKNVYDVDLNDIELEIVSGGIDIIGKSVNNNFDSEQGSDDIEDSSDDESESTETTPTQPPTSDTTDQNASSNTQKPGISSNKKPGSSVTVKPANKDQSIADSEKKEGIPVENNNSITETDVVTDSDSFKSNDEDYEVFLMSFIDVANSDWFYDSVRYVFEQKLMNGISVTEFAPNANLTRAMLVTILYRIENEPLCGYSLFEDVEKDMWYSKSIAWASENNIVKGVGEGMFAPNANITREQIAVILYNYANFKNKSTDNKATLDKYADNSSVSVWAEDAIEWAVSEGIITGKTLTTLEPLGQATRAEAATMLMRYITKY